MKDKRGKRMSTLTIRNVTIGKGASKIIVPLVGSTEEEIMIEAVTVKELKPDVIEWRVDMYKKVTDLAAVTEMIAKLRAFFAEELLLFTFRTHKEGGNKEISEAFYVKLNQTAIRTGNIDLVDVELFTGDEYVQSVLAVAKANGVFVVMSNHDFFKTPSKEEIVGRLCQMQELGADIPKIAVMPNSAADVITLLDATNTMKTEFADRPIITMSMGELGVISRLTGEVFGSAFTFGVGKEASAPGQISVAELRTVLDILHKSL